MKLFELTVAAAVVAGCSGIASAHFDVYPTISGGKLIALETDHTGYVGGQATVFGYDFGETEDAYNAHDPGFNNQGAGVLQGTLGLQILTGLQYWDGTGSVNFAPVSAGQQYMTLSASNQAVIKSSGTIYSSGSYLVLAESIPSGGNIHVHITSSLFAAPGTHNTELMFDDNTLEYVADPDFAAPTAGIYAFQAVMLNVDGATTITSDPIWFVFNNSVGLSDTAADAMEESHAAAIAYFASVPEPATISALGLGALALLARRKRA